MEHEVFLEKSFTLAEYQLVGKVASCLGFMYSAREKKGEISLSRPLGEDCAYFNEKGLLTKKVYYAIGKKSLEKPHSERVSFISLIEYDAQDRIISNITYNKSGKKRIHGEILQYDEHGRKTRVTHITENFGTDDEVITYHEYEGGTQKTASCSKK